MFSLYITDINVYNPNNYQAKTEIANLIFQVFPRRILFTWAAYLTAKEYRNQGEQDKNDCIPLHIFHIEIYNQERYKA